jgi:hypothetical protein|nr:MAG TPA: hypothetical protein [Caudoviricetes sp.]
MFYLRYENSGQTYVCVARATKEVMEKEEVTDFTGIRSQGCLVMFDTKLKIRNSREAEGAFSVLNEYVKWRGDDYIDELYLAIEKIYSITMDYSVATAKDSDAIKNKFCIQLANIIDLLDIEAIHKFVTEVKPLPLPPKINHNFDEQIENDGLGTRNQTYIVEDYKWLMALIVIFKAVYGPLAQLVYGNEDNAMKLPELQMLDILRQQPLNKHHSFIKLKVYVTTIVEKVFDKEKIGDVKVLATQLSRDIIPMLYLSKAMFGKMITMDQTEDPAVTEFDIVRYLFKDVNNKIKNVGSPDEAYRNKNKPNESEIDSEDKESIIESYRIATDVPPGIAVEFNWATKDIETILRQLPKGIRNKITDENLRTGIQLSASFSPDSISNTHLNFLGVLFKSILDPRALRYLKAANIFNFIAIGYAIMIGLEAKPLAYMLVSKRVVSGDDSTMNIASNLNSAKVKGYREDELEVYYPERHIDMSKGDERPGELVILDWARSNTIEMFKYNWITPTILNIGVKDILIATLKNTITDFLIENEKLNKER